MKISAASNGKQAVAVCEFTTGTIGVWKYAPSNFGNWENRDEFARQFARAAGKLGYKRDKRCIGGWRKSDAAKA